MAGFRRVPFLKVMVPVSIGIFVFGWAVFHADAWLMLAGALAIVVWYAIGRFARWIWERTTGAPVGPAA